MAQAQREVFFATCEGKVCVSYTVRSPRSLTAKVGLGLATGALATSAALSNDWPTNSQPAAGEYCDPLRETVIIVGGTSAGKDLQWGDEHEAAAVRDELPEIESSDSLPDPDNDVDT